MSDAIISGQNELFLSSIFPTIAKPEPGMDPHLLRFNLWYGLPCWLSGKESTSNTGDLSSIPGSKDTREKEMTTHSSVLAWEILWTES